ncbi:MAG TPA: hypothetical protein VFW24_07900 [Acidimicrobiales bacterium]|nr:hypothetical protein [Acidimicrobiales bacterium]
MPFRQLRLWAGRAPLPQRVAAGIGAALVVAVVSWLLVPPKATVTTVGAGTFPNSGAGSPGAAPGRAGAATGATVSPAGTAGAGTPGSVAGTSPGGGGGTTPGAPAGGNQAGPAVATPNGTGCSPPPGTDQGVSGADIKIAIIVINIFGPTTNGAFGIASASQQQAYFQNVVNAINSSGGVACRHKLAPVFFQANAADSSNLQQVCLDVEQAKVFAVVDYGAYDIYPSLAACFPNSGLPYISVTLPPQSEQKQFYPYIFSSASTLELLYRNAVMALAGRGFFSASSGFRKLGFLYEDCVAQEPPEVEALLHQVGLSAAQIVTYDLGCPTGFASPSDVEQAVLKFKGSGVTHVTEAGTVPNFGLFTKVAEQQGFRPKYGLPDEGEVAVTNSNEGPDQNNIADAVAITGGRFGEDVTPGMQPTAGTKACSAIFQANGMPPVYQQPLGAGGSACDDLWLLAGAVNHAPALQRRALAAGLQAARSVEFSYPYGPNKFDPGVTTGQEFWRPLQFLTSCGCWRVIDPTFHPSF